MILGWNGGDASDRGEGTMTASILLRIGLEPPRRLALLPLHDLPSMNNVTWNAMRAPTRELTRNGCVESILSSRQNIYNLTRVRPGSLALSTLRRTSICSPTVRYFQYRRI